MSRPVRTALVFCALLATFTMPATAGAESVDQLSNEFSIVEETLTDAQGEFEKSGATAAAFGSSIQAVPAAEPSYPADGSTWSTAIQPSSLVSASGTNSWNVMTFADGSIVRWRLVGTQPPGEIDVADQAVLHEGSMPGGGDVLSVASPDGIEQFVHMDSGVAPGPASFEFEIDLPSGWVAEQGAGRVLIYDDQSWPVLTVDAPTGSQDSAGLPLPTAVTLAEDGESVNLTVWDDAAVGDYVADPSWESGASGNLMYRRWCAINGAACEITSGGGSAGFGNQLGWSYQRSGTSDYYEDHADNTNGMYIRAKSAASIPNGNWAAAKYTPTSGVAIKTFRYSGYLLLDSQNNFSCKVEGDNGDNSTWASTEGAFSRVVDTTGSYAWARFKMQNTSGASYQPSDGYANKCQQRDNNSSDILTATLIDQNQPVSADPTSFTNNGWYKPTDTIAPVYDVSDPGSGVAYVELKINKASGTTVQPWENGTQTEYSSWCDDDQHASASNYPCAPSHTGASSSITLSSWTDTTTASAANEVFYRVWDYARNYTDSNENGGNKYVKIDGTSPLPPAWVADGATSIDLDGTASTTELKATWAVASDQGSSAQRSGIAKYKYCIGTAVNAGKTDCAGTSIVGYTTVTAPTATVTKTGLSLSDGVTYFVCVKSYDSATAGGGDGNVSTVSSCSDGQKVTSGTTPGAPTSVFTDQDESDADAVGVEGATPTVAWTAPAGTPSTSIAGYETCLALTSSAGSCAGGAPVTWSLESDNTHSDFTFSNLSLTEGTTYYPCVRTISVDGAPSTAACDGDGFLADDTDPVSPATVNDGPTSGSDIDSVAVPGQIQATWVAGSDSGGSGVDSYLVCVTTDITAGSCDNATDEFDPLTGEEIGFVVETDQTSVTVPFPPSSTGVKYVICVESVDKAGWISSPATCSDGQTLRGVRDGASSADRAFNTNASEAAAGWNLGGVESDPSFDHFEACVTESSSGTDCSSGAARTWTSVGTGLTTNQTGLSLAESSTYFLCVRAQSTTSTTLADACSDGAEVDSVAPSDVSQSNIIDGAGASDVDTAPRHDYAVDWSASTDSGSGIAGYWTCVRLEADTCDPEEYDEFSETPEIVADDLDGLSFGEEYVTCLKAIDAAGNVANPTCSDGAVIAGDATDEAEVVQSRAAWGLPTDSTTMDAVLADSINDVNTDYLSSEETGLNDHLEDVDNLSEVVATWGDANPSDFAGFEVDDTAGGIVHVQVEQNETASLNAIKALVPDEQEDRLVMDTVPASQADLDQAVAEIEDTDDAREGRGVEIDSVATDPVDGTVVVTTPSGDAQLPEGVATSTALNQAGYSEPIEVVTSSDITEDACCKADKNSVIKKRTKAWAGAIYAYGMHWTDNQGCGGNPCFHYEDGACTTNVSVKLGTSSPRRWMPTAKHCLTGSKNRNRVRAHAKRLRSGIHTYKQGCSTSDCVLREYKFAAKPFVGYKDRYIRYAPRGVDVALVRIKPSWAAKTIYLAWNADDDKDYKLTVASGYATNVGIDTRLEFTGYATKKIYGTRWDEGTVSAQQGSIVAVKRLDVCGGDSGGPVYRETGTADPDGAGKAKIAGVLIGHEATSDQTKTDKWRGGSVSCSGTSGHDQADAIGYFVKWSKLKSLWSNIIVISG